MLLWLDALHVVSCRFSRYPAILARTVEALEAQLSGLADLLGCDLQRACELPAQALCSIICLQPRRGIVLTVPSSFPDNNTCMHQRRDVPVVPLAAQLSGLAGLLGCDLQCACVLPAQRHMCSISCLQPPRGMMLAVPSCFPVGVTCMRQRGAPVASALQLLP
jgi:hypothetical protein